MLANLFGDFVKGRDYTHLPHIIQKGVTLHRDIDDFIDTHPLVKELRLKLYEDLPKIAGVAIDLYFDHLLANNWKEYHSEKLPSFVDNFFEFAIPKIRTSNTFPDFTFPKRFQELLEIMNKQNWIKRYQHTEGLTMASTGLSQRISFDNNLYDATEVFLMNQTDITEVFTTFMKEAQKRYGVNKKM